MSGRIGKKVGVISLGCSKNRVNTEQMMFLLREAGYLVSGDTDSADIALLNTCGFIESAKSEAIENIFELAAAKAKGKIGKIIVAGCLPERHKEDILTELPEIDAVVGTGSFDDIVDVVSKLDTSKQVLSEREILEQKSPESGNQLSYFGNIDASISETDRIISTSPVWAYLKIAEGCDNRCAYCCIPDIRGRFRSRPMENIIDEAKKLVAAGIKELIIVAQDVTRYGVDIYGKRRLSDLLTALNEIVGLKWIRLHYLYPNEFDDELIDVIAKSDKILKYLDIPIQHIDDKILREMDRRGTGSDIRDLFKRLRERIPGVVLRTSFITGLPGENEAEFARLKEFLQEAKIERAGVFAYSPEEGTKAALMDRPDKNTAEKRAEKLQVLQSKIIEDWNKSRVGSVLTVLVEDIEAEGIGAGDIEVESLSVEGFEVEGFEVEGFEAEDIEVDVQGQGKKTTYHLARSFAESPEIDGYIYVKGPLKPNVFIDIKITEKENGILIGEPVKLSKHSVCERGSCY